MTLRSIKAIAIDGCERDLSDPDFATWLVTGHDSSGRVDTEIGSVSTVGLKGEAKANAIMKALTKAKRRLTLSLAGLGWLDEIEVGSVPSAVPVNVDAETGEIIGSAPAAAVERQTVPLAAKAAASRARIEARQVEVPPDTSGLIGPDQETVEAPTEAVSVTALCEAPDPVDQAHCVLDAGHEGWHADETGVTWR